MNLRVARKVGWNGLLAEVLDRPSVVGKGHLEAAQVVGEEDASSRRQPAQELPDQLGMIALHVEVVLEAPRVREGRSIAEHQIEDLVGPRQVRVNVRADQLVVAAIESVGLEVLLGPFQIGVGQIDADRATRTGPGGIDGGRPV